MKAILLSFFVALAVAAPTSLNDGDAVELIVNGVPEGTPLEVADIVDIKLHQTNDGEVVAASDLLYPLTAQGIAETAAAAAAIEVAQNPADNSLPQIQVEEPESVVLPAPVMPEIVPEPIILPAPAVPEVVPAPVILPAPVRPEVVPEPVILPAPVKPEVVPEPVVLPAPAIPEVIPEPVVLPAPAIPEVVPEPVELPVAPAPEVVMHPPVLQGEVYNDGIVSLTVNTAHAAVSSTLEYLQSWYSVVINYFYNGKEVGKLAL